MEGLHLQPLTWGWTIRSSPPRRLTAESGARLEGLHQIIHAANLRQKERKTLELDGFISNLDWDRGAWSGLLLH